MNELNDTNILIKKKFLELLNDLNEIIEIKWPLLSNNGLTIITKISNIFTSKLFNSNDDNIDDIADKTNSQNNNITNTLQAVNVEFINLNQILESFEHLIDRLKQIESRLVKIFEFNGELISNKIEQSSFNDLFKAYYNEFELKKSLIKKHLFEMRDKQTELIAISSYWMHEPCLDQFVISKFKSFYTFYTKNL